MTIVDCSELALKKVKIRGNVIGKFGIFEIEQKFVNETRKSLEVKYTFPIVETATVNGFEIEVGDKKLIGVSKEKEAAKEEYQNNMVKGNSSYLMEQRSKNVFDINIGRILPKEEVTVRIKYIDKFEIVDNIIQIIIPTLVAPKYKSKITDILHYGSTNYSVDFEININKSVNRKSVECTTHNVQVVDNGKFETVQVKDQDLSKDFKLNIELKNELSSNAIKTNNYVYMSFMPEIIDQYSDNEKEYIFIVDVSGSMRGVKLEETKNAVIECLKNIDEGDKFNIIAFSSEFEAFEINSIEYNEENLKRAINYIKSLQANGGTEILNPIEFALYEKDNTEKVILLFTDGQVGNENEIVDFVSKNINNGRLFAFGIDTSVNSSFIKEISKVGNGKSELIMPGERIDEKIIRTFARIQTPLLKNVKVDYGKNNLLDEIKEENTLFNYEYFNVFAELENLIDDIKLCGEVLNQKYEWIIKKEQILESNVDVETLFAKQKIDRYNEYYKQRNDINYKAKIIKLAEKYNINSEFTSFITVNEREEKDFSVPQYQDTILNRPNSWGERLSSAAPMFSKAKFSMDSFSATPFAGASMNNSRMSVLRELSDDCMCDCELSNNVNLTADKIFEYYKNTNIENLEIHLLLFLYFLKNHFEQFDFENELKYVEDNKDEIKNNDEYLKILCLICKEMVFYKTELCERAKGMLTSNYLKIIETNMKFSTIFSKISYEEYSKFMNEGIDDKNIREVLVYLI